MVAAAAAQQERGEQGRGGGGQEDGALGVGEMRLAGGGEFGDRQETVKPIPPSTAIPAMSAQPSSGLRWALVRRLVGQVPPKIPTTLPTSRPARTFQVMAEVTKPPAPARETPADISAKSGSAIPAENGRKTSSARCEGDTRPPPGGGCASTGP